MICSINIRTVAFSIVLFILCLLLGNDCGEIAGNKRERERNKITAPGMLKFMVGILTFKQQRPPIFGLLIALNGVFCSLAT